MDEHGSASELEVSYGACSDDFKDQTVGVPGPGKLYLVFEHLAFRRSTSGLPDVSQRTFRLDEVRFE